METPNRSKLDLELNQPRTFELIFDNPLCGENRYGPYALYALVDTDTGEEFSYFAPMDVHEKLKACKRGDMFTITKNAKQQGKKIVTSYSIVVHQPEMAEALPASNGNGNGDPGPTAFDVMFPPNGTEKTNGNGKANGNGNGHAAPKTNGAKSAAEDSYYAAMLASCRDAQKIQAEIAGIDINKIAMTLFIAKSKTGGYSNAA